MRFDPKAFANRRRLEVALHTLSTVTAHSLALEANVHVTTARRFLKKLHADKRVHISARDYSFARAMQIFSVGPGDDAINNRGRKGVRIRRPKWKDLDAENMAGAANPDPNIFDLWEQRREFLFTTNNPQLQEAA